MAKKKSSESRKHTAMIRVDEEAREQAMLAAALLKMSLADYASEILKRTAKKDMDDWAAKRTKPKGAKHQ